MFHRFFPFDVETLARLRTLSKFGRQEKYPQKIRSFDGKKRFFFADEGNRAAVVDS
jgi:hypothetical protein